MPPYAPHPTSDTAVKRGSYGFVLKASWSRGRPSTPPVKVAVKIIKVSGHDAAALASAELKLREECAKLSRAADRGINKFVVAFHALALGAATEEWRIALGDECWPLVRASRGLSPSASPLDPTLQAAPSKKRRFDGGAAAGEGAASSEGPQASSASAAMDTGTGEGTASSGGSAAVAKADDGGPSIALLSGRAPSDSGGSLYSEQAALFSMMGMVMSYEEGGTLHEKLHPRASLAAPWAATMQMRLSMLSDVAEGLQLLHENSIATIVHGDLKPENVLLNAKGAVRLADFGLAAVKEFAASSTGSASGSAEAGGKERASGTVRVSVVRSAIVRVHRAHNCMRARARDCLPAQSNH
jgi:serine/threonine protein kinase